MAKKISELVAIGTMSDDDVMPIVDTSANTTNKVPLSDLASTLNELANPVVLYDNASGSDTEITLTDSSANYTYLEIFYKNNNDQYSSVKVYQPNGKLVSLFTCQPSATSYIKATIVEIATNKITPTRYSQMVIRDSAYSNVGATTNYSLITRVLGYK